MTQQILADHPTRDVPLDSTRLSANAAPRVLNVAHRGASSSAPENTVPAIYQAALAGADVVEVDLRRSRDGALVLLHDANLERTTNVRQVYPNRGPWRVADFTFDELVRLDAGSWFGAEYAGTTLATLEDALSHARRCGVGLLVELKSPEQAPGILQDVASALRRDGVSGEAARTRPQADVVVQSFHHLSMRTLKELAPEVPVGLLGGPPVRHLAAAATWADQVNPSSRRLDERYVRAVHDQGMTCHAWTVNRRSAMKRVLALGVDGLITDRPADLARVLGRGSGAALGAASTPSVDIRCAPLVSDRAQGR